MLKVCLFFVMCVSHILSFIFMILTNVAHWKKINRLSSNIRFIAKKNFITTKNNLPNTFLVPSTDSVDLFIMKSNTQNVLTQWYNVTMTLLACFCKIFNFCFLYNKIRVLGSYLINTCLPLHKSQQTFLGSLPFFPNGNNTQMPHCFLLIWWNVFLHSETRNSSIQATFWTRLTSKHTHTKACKQFWSVSVFLIASLSGF